MRGKHFLEGLNHYFPKRKRNKQQKTAGLDQKRKKISIKLEPEIHEIFGAYIFLWGQGRVQKYIEQRGTFQVQNVIKFENRQVSGATSQNNSETIPGDPDFTRNFLQLQL